jgi:hypothetical protein
VLQRPACSFRGVPDALSDAIEHLARAFADLLDRLSDAVDQLRIPVECGHHAINDRRDVVEPHLEQCLRLDPLQIDLELVEVSFDADVDFEEIEDLGLQRHLHLEVLDLQVDRVDLDHRNV